MDMKLDTNKKITSYSIRTHTEYFAKKNTIFSALRFFKENKDFSEVEVEAIYLDGVITTNVLKEIIIKFLGYDFTLDEEKLLNDKTEKGNKLYHKTNILKLFNLLTIPE